MIHRWYRLRKDSPRTGLPDLNQVVTSLMCSYRSTIPVWLEVLSGNTSDKTTFKESIRRYRKQFQQKRLPYFVADSALYTKTTLTELDEVKWVTRVPETINEAKQVITQLNKDAMTVCDDSNYRFMPYRSSYGEIKQRWIIVYSQKAFEILPPFLAGLARPACAQ